MSLFQISMQRENSEKPSAVFILYKRFCRYLKVGKLLHLVSIMGIICFYCFGRLAMEALLQDRFIAFCVQGYLSGYGLVLIGFSQMDARSRFQNYKLAKDLFFEHGFKERIADLFALSRCQREAVIVAAWDLGIELKLIRYYQSRGYRWFHIFPDKVLSQPSILMRRRFWQKTLFVPHYSSRQFLW